MDHLLRLHPPVNGQPSMIAYDPAREKLLERLRPRGDICPEENRERLAHRRYSDILPLRRANTEDRISSIVSEYKKAGNSDFTPGRCYGDLPHRIVSAPPPGRINSYHNNINTTFLPFFPNQKGTLVQFNPRISLYRYPAITSSDSLIAEPSASRQHTIGATSEGDQFMMSGTRIPRPQPGPRPRHPLNSHLPDLNTTAPYVQFPREDLASSMLPLGVRDNSIRMIHPNLTLSTSQKPKEATGYSTSGQAGTSQLGIMSGIKATDEYSQPQHKQPLEVSKGYGHSRGYSAVDLLSQPSSLTQDGKSASANRGRTMRQRYEFVDSDDQSYTEPSPDDEAAKKDDDNKGEDSKDTGRESNVTTVEDMMQRFGGAAPLRLPHRQHHRAQTDGGVAGSATQPSLPQAKKKDRPAPLNLNNPVYLGTVSRHTNRYEIEHIAIKSSKAEHVDLYGSNTGPSASDYYVRNPPRMGPLQIPNEELCRTDPLEAYREWRANLNPSPTSSQGSIHVTMPSDEEDALPANANVEETRPTGVNHPVAQDTSAVNRMRSRSALGIKDNYDKEERQAPVSGNTRYTSSEYSTATPVFQKQGMTRSATVHDVPHHRRALTGQTLKPDDNGNMEPSPLFTPLTPFIMKVTGAPAGIERGAKTLFGEHGWLEDTAASGATKPKVEKEKAGGFMESLKRKARGIADGTSFKPVRNFRTSEVKRINISLDAREQSLLYCELEYNLNNALDAYLKAQFNTGRLDASKLSRIADAWAQKGRPKVIGFRYDLETQIELISLHVEEFRFYGRAQAEGPAVITGLLYTMKINARCMRVRTFCQPDSLIAKHILDAQNFLRLLGSSESLQRPLEEVAQFFKVAVNRRRIMAEAPAARPTNRLVSDASEQCVPFEGAGGQQFGHHAETQEAGKSRTNVGDQGYANAKTQTVKSQKDNRGPDKQDQSGAAAQAMGVHGSAHGRSRSGPRQ